MVNHFSFGVNTFYNNGGSINVGKDWKDKVCIPNAIDCNKNMGIITFSELSSWGASSLNGTYQPRWSIKNDTTFIRGNHTFKTGMTFDRQQANGVGEQRSAALRGSASFRQASRAERRSPMPEARRLRRFCLASRTPAAPRRIAIFVRFIHTGRSTGRTTGG